MKRLLFFLLFPVMGFCQGAMTPPQTALKTVNGITSPLANATVTVCAAGASGIPCAPALAGTIFKDTGLTVPLSNPFTADANGNYQFAAVPGTYTVTQSGSGFSGYSYQITLGISSSANTTFSGNLTLSGNDIFTGSNTFQSIGPIKWANSSTSGADCGAKIMTQDAALGVTPGEIWIDTTCGNITSAVNLTVGQRVLKFFPGNYSLSAGITMGVTGSGITGTSPCGRSSGGTTLFCPTTLTAANGTNLSSLITFSSGNNSGFLENFALDGNKANNPTGGVDFLANQIGAQRIRAMTIRNAPTHGIFLSGNLSACCPKIQESMVIGNGADGGFFNSFGDVEMGGEGEWENNGIQSVVNTSGSTITYVSGGTWSSDSSLIGTRVAIIASGVATTYVITANTTATLTVSPSIGSNSGVTMLLGAGIECKDAGACQATSGTDVSGNAESGYLNWGTASGRGNPTPMFGGTHSLGNNLGWDVLILCYDTVGSAQTGNNAIIFGNNFLGGTRAASNVFSEVKLQDCGFSTISGNIFQSSASARAAIEFSETSGGRAGFNTVVGNTWGSGFVTAATIDNPTNKSNFTGNQDGTGNIQLGPSAFIPNNTFLKYAQAAGTKQNLLGTDASNNVYLDGDPTQQQILFQTNPGSLQPLGLLGNTARFGTNTNIQGTEGNGTNSGNAGFDNCLSSSTSLGIICNFNNDFSGRLQRTVASGTASMTTALIAAGACGTTVTVAATGVTTTDTINEDFNAAVTAANNGLLIFHKWPTSGNVNFNYCNPGAVGVTPTAMTVNWSVTR